VREEAAEVHGALHENDDVAEDLGGCRFLRECVYGLVLQHYIISATSVGAPLSFLLVLVGLFLLI